MKEISLARKNGKIVVTYEKRSFTLDPKDTLLNLWEETEEIDLLLDQQGFNKNLTCGHWGHMWEYKGKSKYYATCPRCHANVEVNH